MSWEYVLIWIVCLSTGLQIALALKNRVRLLHPFVLLQVFVFVGTLIGAFQHKQAAALVGGLIWFVFVLFPFFLMHWIRRAEKHHAYSLALRLVHILSFVHPAHIFKQQKQMFRALIALQDDFETGLSLLHEMAQSDSPMQASAQHLIFFLERDWDGLFAYVEDSISEEENIQPHQLLWFFRGAVEVGQTEQAIDRFIESFKLYPTVHERLFDACMSLFAYTGDVEVTRALLTGPMSHELDSSKSILLAVAEQASGEQEAAFRRLEPLLKHSNVFVRTNAQRRIESPILEASSQLKETHFAFLNGLKELLFRELIYTGKLRSHLRPWLVWSITFVLFGVYLVSEYLGGSMQRTTLLQMGAMVPKLVSQGEYWRLFAFPWLHYGPVHMLLNCITLLLFGPFVERTLGRLHFSILWLLTSVGGGLLIALFALAQKTVSVSYAAYVGASGAIFGLIGAMFVIQWEGWKKQASSAAKRNVGILFLLVLLQTCFDISTPGISMGAHWSGLLLGIAYTYWIWKPHTLLDEALASKSAKK